MKEVRRVLTGHAGDDPVVLADSSLAGQRPVPAAPISTVIWTTSQMPADISRGLDIADARLQSSGTAPPVNGSRFVIVDLPPRFEGALHRTETIDYGVVVSGDVEMVLGSQRLRLGQGDCIVQRGTDHAWCNPSDTPARLAFVLLDALPLDIGTPLGRGRMPQ